MEQFSSIFCEMFISMEICPKKNPVLTQRDNIKLSKLVQNKLLPLNNSKHYTLRENGFANFNTLKNLPKLKKENIFKFIQTQRISRFQQHMHFGELWDKQNLKEEKDQERNDFQLLTMSEKASMQDEKSTNSKIDDRIIFVKDQVPLTFLQEQKNYYQERFRDISNQIQKKKKIYLQNRQKKERQKQQRKKRKLYTTFFNPLLKSYEEYMTSKSIKSTKKLSSHRNRQNKLKTEHQNKLNEDNRIKQFIQKIKGPSLTCHVSQQKKLKDTEQQIDFVRLKMYKPNMKLQKMKSYIETFQLSNVSTNSNFKLKKLQTLVKKNRDDDSERFQLGKSRQKQRITDPSLVSAKLRLASNHKKIVGVVKQLKY